MKKYIALIVIMAAILCGCTTEKKVMADEDISYAPVVCEYTTTPVCWTVVDCISTNIKIYNDNTVEVYCGDFFGGSIYEDDRLEIEYIYGETFEITEAQKQFVIETLEKNEIAQIEDCGDNESCDGSYSYIRLFDEDGETVHSCGGLNPYDKNFTESTSAIFSVLPKGTVGNVRNKATDILVDYLLENHAEDYKWLAEERGM